MVRQSSPSVLMYIEGQNAVTQQLTDGIRMLQMQAHNDSGVIQLCHTSCVSSSTFRCWPSRNISAQVLYNGGTLAAYLTKGNVCQVCLFFPCSTAT
jgi:hypothetical protein